MLDELFHRQTLDNGGYNVENPGVAMNGSGDAMVVWDQLDATSGSNMRVYVQVGDYEIVCGDGTVDETESCDDSNTTDGDGCSATCATEVEQICNNSVDDDGNGLTDCDDNSCATSLDCMDSGGDTVSDPATLDSDGDGVTDPNDVFPQDATEWADADQDGVGDNADIDDGSIPILLDSDGDGVDDTQDAFPSNASETLDSDGDGIGNTADSDDDNDGVSDGVDSDDDIPDTEDADADSDADGLADSQDAFPTDATATTDTDGDGVDDAEDTDDSDESASAGADVSAVSTGCGCSFASYHPNAAHQNGVMGFLILLMAWIWVRFRIKITSLAANHRV